MPTLHTERVLIADGNGINQQVILRMLQRLGYRVDDGAQAFAAIRSEAHGIVFMDIQMPELDGLETSRPIRSLAEMTASGQQPWIIALIANAIHGDRAACLDAGMNDYLSKRIKLADVERVLRRAQTAHR